MVDESWKTSAFWTEEEGRAALAAWRRSGLSMNEFHRRHGLGRTRLQPWARKERAGQLPPLARSSKKSATPERPRGRLVAVKVVGGAAPFEVVLRGGTVVRVGARFDPSELRRLLAVLVQLGC